MTKPISKIAVTMRHGQMIDNVARNGRPKKLTAPALATGMKRQTTGNLHPYLHGQKLCDEPNTVDKLTGKSAPIHPGMTSKIQRDTDRGPDQASAVLAEAGRLGAPAGGWKPPEKT